MKDVEPARYKPVAREGLSKGSSERGESGGVQAKGKEYRSMAEMRPSEFVLLFSR